MNLIKRVVLLVGVTLSVTPIFSLAQSSNDARLLSELQALRGEIAELRDMVERQQHELQKMKRAQQPVVPGNTPYDNTPGNIGSAPAAIPNSGTANPSGYPVASAPEYQAPSNGDLTVPNAGQQPQLGSDPAYPNADEGFYRPLDEPAISGEVSAAETNVEERIITAPPLVQNSQADNYPPVEDRSIGGPAAAPNLGTAPSLNRPPQPSRVQTYPSNSGVGVNTNPSVAASGTPVAGAAVRGASVVAIPGAVNAGSPAVNQQQRASTVQPTQAVQAAPPSQVATSAPSVLAEQEYYQQGFNLVRQGEFQDAINVFKQLIDQHPTGSLVGDAHYWIGESSFLDRDLDTSKQYFKAFMENYPQSARVPGAMLRTAYIEQEQGNQMEARILLNEIIQFYPSSDAVHAAKNRLAAIENNRN